jgi:hypothetical protein
MDKEAEVKNIRCRACGSRNYLQVTIGKVPNWERDLDIKSLDIFVCMDCEHVGKLFPMVY